MSLPPSQIFKLRMVFFCACLGSRRGSQTSSSGLSYRRVTRPTRGCKGGDISILFCQPLGTWSEEEDCCVQVVKSESCSVRVPELDFEIPSTTQKGSITTVEGLLGDAVTGLSSSQVPEDCRRLGEHLRHALSGYACMLRSVRHSFVKKGSFLTAS